MQVKIISSSGEIYKTENAESLSAPGESGDMQILDKHADIVSVLKIGEVRVKKGSELEKIVINGGMLVFRDNIGIILANEADKPQDLVESEIDKAIQSAEEKLASDIEPSELIQLEKRLRYEKFKKQSIQSVA